MSDSRWASDDARGNAHITTVRHATTVPGGSAMLDICASFDDPVPADHPALLKIVVRDIEADMLTVGILGEQGVPEATPS